MTEQAAEERHSSRYVVQNHVHSGTWKVYCIVDGELLYVCNADKEKAARRISDALAAYTNNDKDAE